MSLSPPGQLTGHGLERKRLKGAPRSFTLSYSLGLMVSLVPCPNTSFWPLLPELHHSKQLYTNHKQGPSHSPLRRTPDLLSQHLRYCGQWPDSPKPDRFRWVCFLGLPIFSLTEASLVSFVDMYQNFNLYASQTFNIFTSIS